MTSVDFGHFSVPSVTNEISAHVSVSVDTTKVAEDISKFKDSVSSRCTQLYIPTFQFEYGPTASAIKDIPDGERQDTASQLDSYIKEGQFTANINIALAGDTDSANEATWFLYNLWTTLAVLNFPDVNNAISEYEKAGLNIPTEVSANHWDQGEYNVWFTPSTGSFLYSNTFKTSMQESALTVSSGGASRERTEYLSNGYSLSFCDYGSLALYKPQSSCFGAGTNVLMGDNSVKDISSVKKGDMVATTRGPREVIMVESPLLEQRTLWNINELNMSCTEGHCFRAYDEEKVKRLAVDELVTMDSAPTMSMNGSSVGKCKIGSQILAKLYDGEDVVAYVNTLSRTQKQSDENVRVYDIILDKWWKDNPSYFVGGADSFLAVDAETSNPTSDPPTSAAILSAMDLALSACDNPFVSPFLLMSLACATLDLITIERRANEMAWQVLEEEPPKSLRIPETDIFEKEDGQWSELASYMEYFLISMYGRWIRSIVRVTAEPAVEDALPDDMIAIGIHDIELSGDHGMPPNSSLSVAATLSNGQQKQSQKLDVAHTGDEWCYFFEVHRRSMFSEADSHSHSHLSGVHLWNGVEFANFERSITLDKVHGRFLHTFLYAPNHMAYKVIGRVGISVRRVRESYGEWKAEDDGMMLAKGVAVGRQLGYQLGAALEQSGGKISFNNWVK